MAIIKWFEDNFDHLSPVAPTARDSSETKIFKIGDLEDGIREILEAPQMSPSVIRTHTANLRTGKLITVNANDDDEATRSSRLVDTKNKTALISRDQLDRMVSYRNTWDLKQIANTRGSISRSR